MLIIVFIAVRGCCHCRYRSGAPTFKAGAPNPPNLRAGPSLQVKMVQIGDPQLEATPNKCPTPKVIPAATRKRPTSCRTAVLSIPRPVNAPIAAPRAAAATAPMQIEMIPPRCRRRTAKGSAAGRHRWQRRERMRGWPVRPILRPPDPRRARAGRECRRHLVIVRKDAGHGFGVLGRDALGSIHDPLVTWGAAKALTRPLGTVLRRP